MVSRVVSPESICYMHAAQQRILWHLCGVLGTQQHLSMELQSWPSNMGRMLNYHAPYGKTELWLFSITHKSLLSCMLGMQWSSVGMHGYPVKGNANANVPQLGAHTHQRKPTNRHSNTAPHPQGKTHRSSEVGQFRCNKNTRYS